MSLSYNLVRQYNRTILFVSLLIFAMIYFMSYWQEQTGLAAESFHIEKPKIEEQEVKADLAWDDIELVSFVSKGTISMGFKARIKGRGGLYIAKVTGDRRLHWSDTEIDMFKTLNAPPTILNIPKLELAVKSMPNPFYNNHAYLKETLGMTSRKALEFLPECKNISVMVMEYLDRDDNRLPSSITELRIFLRSLLSAFNFAHSRNVMMCDLHLNNVHFDGTTVKLFDWNAGFIYKPNSVKIHYRQAPRQLFPPEAWNNESAVHATVSGFDIWTIGLLLEKVLKTIDKDSIDYATYALLVQFMNATLTEDPYNRPDANKLLNHKFLK